MELNPLASAVIPFKISLFPNHFFNSILQDVNQIRLKPDNPSLCVCIWEPFSCLVQCDKWWFSFTCDRDDCLKYIGSYLLWHHEEARSCCASLRPSLDGLSSQTPLLTPHIQLLGALCCCAGTASHCFVKSVYLSTHPTR